MITEDYVNFEVAKLLKEKGFDWETHRSYLINDNVFIPGDITNVPLRKDAIRIPTIQMAMKWLNEVHHILVVSDYEYEFTDTSWYYKIYRLGDNGKPERVPVKGVSYDNSGEHEHIVGYRDYERSYKDYATREEAGEEGIRYVLENLI